MWNKVQCDNTCSITLLASQIVFLSLLLLAKYVAARILGVHVQFTVYWLDYNPLLFLKNDIFLSSSPRCCFLTGWHSHFFCAGPICSACVVNFGARPVTIFSGVMISGGLMLSAFAPNVHFLMFSYGVVVGTFCVLCLQRKSLASW